MCVRWSCRSIIDSDMCLKRQPGKPFKNTTESNFKAGTHFIRSLGSYVAMSAGILFKSYLNEK